MEKKLNKCGEPAFLAGTLLLGLGTAIMSGAGFGMSVAVAPAYILAEAVKMISTGTMCYVWQGFLVILACFLAGRFKPGFLFTFFAAVVFGVSVDIFTALLFHGAHDFSMPLRLILFAIGMPVCSLAIAILLNSYLPPQAPELFVKELAKRFHLDMYKVKYGFDLCVFVLSLALTLLFFRALHHIGWGTLFCAVFNGPLIAFFGKRLVKFVDFSPRFPKLKDIFD